MKNSILFSLCVLFASTVALADPVQVVTEQSPLQDNWALEGWVEELSTAPHDAIRQLINSVQIPWQGHVPCPQDYLNELAGTTVQVAITNRTHRHFEDLYYVGDVHDYPGILETTFTNVDEWVADVTPGNQWTAPGLAFKIDAVGLNTPLVFESMTPDQIFEPGETWEFVIQEYANIWGAAGLPPSALGSVGLAPYGAIAQASMLDQISSGSIITPEPATIAMLGLGGLAMLRRRKNA